MGKKLKYLYINFERNFANQIFEKYTAKEGIKWKIGASSIPKQNSKTKCLNYIFISLVCLILLAIYLAKTIWDKIIKNDVYLENLSPDINGITSFKLDDYMRLNLSYLKVVESCVLIYILKKKKLS